MKSILVTGCKGVIGAAVAEALRGLGYRIKGIDLRLPRGDPGHGDIQDAEFVKELAKGCQGIIHLAGISRVIWGEKDPAFRPRELVRWIERFPEAKVVRLPDVGHFIAEEVPDRLADEVEQFIQSE